jgi:hypothetical protein
MGSSLKLSASATNAHTGTTTAATAVAAIAVRNNATVRLNFSETPFTYGIYTDPRGIIFNSTVIPKVSLTLLLIPRVAVVRIKRKDLWALCISHM